MPRTIPPKRSRRTAKSVSEEKFCDVLASRLGPVGLSREQLRSFASELDVERRAVLPNLPRGTIGFLFPRWRYVIRDDDLKLLDSLFDGVKAAATVGFFTAAVSGPQLASAGVGMLVAASKLLRQAMKKGACLDVFEFRVLWLLKANAPGGLTVEDIVTILRRCEDVEPPMVEAALGRLSKFAVSDGSTVPLVSNDGAGCWRAAGV